MSFLNSSNGNDGEELTSRLKKGSRVKLVLRSTGIWLASGKFGCSWRAEQMIISTPEGLEDFAFRDDEDDVHQKMIESESDDEEDEEEEVSAQPKRKTR